MTSIVYVQSNKSGSLNILYTPEDNPYLAAQCALCYIDDLVEKYVQLNQLKLKDNDLGEFTLDAILEGKILSYSIQVNLIGNDVSIVYMSWYGTIDED